MSTQGTDRQDANALRRALAAIQDLRARLEAAERGNREPIAIVGIGCRFPGPGVDPEAFWDMLDRGESAVVEVPADRWDLEEWYDPDPEKPGKTYSRHGAFVRDIDQFDASFFEISPREARTLDPQHRMLLEVSWQALENAAINPASVRGRDVGVFVGIAGMADYSLLGLSSMTSQGSPFAASGSAASIAAGRLSYFLGTHGPAVSYDTACSSSLVAVHEAMQSLRRRECEMALAGGVAATLAPHVIIALCQARMLSPQGQCRSFDAEADGYVRGEGCGMLVLKRLSDARAAGDRVVAVLRGSAVNQDGRSSGLTAPNGKAQEALLRAALRDAGVTADEVGYLEAHGTGTRLGDPIELRAIQAVFEAERTAGHALPVGSVKTNIGHLEAAAGIAGVLKVIGALRRERIPQHLNFSTPNPAIDWARGTVQVPTESVPWPKGDRPRIAGVSSFGYSGTNAHVILEEAAPEEADPGVDRGRSLVTLSARSAEALRASAEALAAHLDRTPARLADVSYTLAVGRAGFAHRAAMVVASIDEARDRLRELAAGTTTNVPTRSGVSAERPRVAFLYTGQGSQYAGMGRQLFEQSPVFRDAMLECDAALDPIEGRSLVAWLYDAGADAEGRLDQTGYAQPALFSLEYALTKVWQSWGIEPVAVLGHSVGEFAAACAAGVMSLADGLRLIAARARLMQALPAGGGMLAVRAPLADIETDVKRVAHAVAVAAVNGPDDVVLSGALDALETLAAEFKARGLSAKPLRVSHAFHSPLIAPMVDEFRRVAESITYRPPSWRLISNLTGQPLGETRIDADYWCRHLLAPVLFGPSMETLRGLQIDVFLEVGPHPVLVGMASKGDTAGVSAWTPSLRRGRDDWATMLAALGDLFLHGASWDARAAELPARPRKIVLPAYPFERSRYWLDNPRKLYLAPVATLTRSAVSGEVVLESDLSTETFPWIRDYRIQDRPSYPAAGYISLVLEAYAEAGGAQPAAVSQFTVARPFFPVPDDGRRIQVALTPADDGSYRAVVSATATAGVAAAWLPLADGVVGPVTEASEAPRPQGDRSDGTTSIDLDGFYRRADASVGLVRGARFRNVRSIESGPSGATVVVGVPTGEGALAPLLDTVIAQAADASWLRDAAGTSPGMAVPVRLDRVWVAPGATAASELTCEVTRQASADAVTIVEIRARDEAGTLVIEALGTTLRELTRDEVTQQARLHDRLLYDVAWRALPSPRATDIAGTSWLLLADSSGVASALAAWLERRGGVARIARPGGAAAGADQLYELIGRDRIDGVVDLRSIAVDEADVAGAAVRTTTEALAALQAVTRAAEPIPFVMVTRGAAGPTPGAWTTLAGSPLWGLARVVRSENPDLRLQIVDVDPGAQAEAAAAWIGQELAGADTVDWQVAYRDGRRHGLRIASLEPPATMQPGTSLFRKDGTYLVTGGLGALGLRVAQWMAECGAGHVLLVGRSEPSEEAVRLMAAIEAVGTVVHVGRADVAKRSDVERLLASIPAATPLRGVVHAAGILDDGLARDMTAERLRRVMAPKVDGAWHLHDLTRGMAIDVFAMFASSAGLFGSPGQANYAAANAFLDALAWHRRSAGLAGVSVDWGPWGEVGMAARLGARDQNRIGSGGVEPLDLRAGLDAFGEALRAGRPQLVGMDIDWAALWRAIGDIPAPAFLREFAPRVAPATSGQPAAAPTLRVQTEGLKAMAPAERLATITGHVRNQLRAVLALDADAPIRDDQPFMELGMDSLVAVELSNRLKPLVGRPLGATLAFDQPTVAQLSAHLDRVVQGGEETERSDGRFDGDQAPGSGVLLARLPELSESEVDAELERLERLEREESGRVQD